MKDQGYAALLYYTDEMGPWIMTVTVYASCFVDYWLLTHYGQLNLWIHIETGSRLKWTARRIAE